MNVHQILLISIAVLSVAIIILILLQQRGGGFGTIFGGSGGETYRTRRGAEKFIFYLTISLAIIWTGLLIANLILS